MTQAGEGGASAAAPASSPWTDSLAGVYRSTAAGLILECNAAFAATFGYASPEEVKAVPAQALYTEPAERDGHLERLRTLGAIHSGEMRMRRRDGTPIWIIYTERLVRDGERELIEGTLIDVTARHQAEASLQQASRLAAVGALAAGVAHDLNSPLASMLANLQFVREVVARAQARLAGGPERQELEEALQALAETGEAARRMTTTVRRLHPYASRVAPQVEPLDLRAVLDRALSLADASLRLRARVVRRYQPAPTIAAEEGVLVQAFLSVLSNAAAALSGGSPERNTVTVVVESTPDGAQVTFVDDGPGLAPPALAQALDPALATGRAELGGGLAAARALVLEAGGELSVESLLGHGTSVSVRFPAAPRGPGAAAEADRSPDPG